MCVFKIYFFFKWRIITLQNFVVFCQTSTWIRHRCTYIPSLWTSLPTPPLWVSSEPLFEFPEPYRKFPLAICFTYGTVSPCFSSHTPYPLPMLLSSFFIIYLVSYLAVPGVSCGTQDLRCIMQGPSLQHTDSAVLVCKSRSCSIQA